MAGDAVLLPWPPVFEPRRGDALTGAYTRNVFIDKESDGSLWVTKRPGFKQKTAATTEQGLGYYYDSAWSLYLTTANVYLAGVAKGVTPDKSDGYWFNRTNGIGYIYTSNGAYGYYGSALGTFAQITDTTYTGTISPTVPGSAFLDGTLYVMNADAKIYGSKNLNDPRTWDATNMIVAQDTPGVGIAIAKHLVYVVAFKDKSVEFFYDAGSYSGTLTGSPLLPVPTAKIDYGCLDGRSVADVGGALYWLAVNKQGMPCVMRIAGMKPEVISTPFVDRYLAQYPGPNKGVSMLLGGHPFYVIQPYYQVRPSGQPVQAPGVDALAFDTVTGMWHLLPLSTFTLQTYGLGSSILQAYDMNDSTLIQMDATAPVWVDYAATGNTAAIQSDIVTLPFDGGTHKVKVLSKLRILTDSLGAGSLRVRWSDDDYKTWSQWVTVNLSVANPFLVNLGTFVRRAFHFQHSSATPFRMKGAEMTLQVGQ